MVLENASKLLVSVLDIVKYSKECMERSEFSSLSNTKVSGNPLGASSGT